MGLPALREGPPGLAPRDGIDPALAAPILSVPDGGTWETNGLVNAAVTAPDGTTYIGGNFSRVVPRTGGAARLDTATGVARGAQPYVAGNVGAVAVSGSTVYAGGSFTSVGGQTRSYVARFVDTPPTTTLTTVPASADGENGWYVSTPDITLTADEPATRYYRWDSGAWSTYSTTLTAAEGVHTLGYYSVDSAGNTETARGATFKTDTAAPTDPALASPSHSVGVVSRDPTVTVQLSGATDALSGVDGFSVSWSADTSELPDATKDAEASMASTTTALADGSWWLNVRTVDVAGNWSATAHMGPFVIDTVAPGKPGFTSVASGSRFASFEWANPTDSDFDRVRLLRSTGGYASVADGTGIIAALGIGTHQTVVYEGRGTAHRDTGLSNGTAYYYTLFARDTLGNWTAFDTAVAYPVTPRGRAWLSTPRTPWSVRRGRTFTIYGYLRPRHSGWTKTRLLRRTASGWRHYRWV